MAKLSVEGARKFKEYARRLMVIFHPNGYFNWIGVHDAYGDSQSGHWTFMMISSWIPSDPNYDMTELQGDSEKILADLKQRSNQFGDDFNLMWQSIPEGTQCWHICLSYWVPKPWNNYNRTITLIENTAHPMTFHRGQGLNNSIHDVALLAQKTAEHGFTPAAVSAYEEEMLPRAREAVITSNQNSEATHDWNTLLQSPLFTTWLRQKWKFCQMRLLISPSTPPSRQRNTTTSD